MLHCLFVFSIYIHSMTIATNIINYKDETKRFNIIDNNEENYRLSLSDLATSSGITVYCK